MAMTPYSGDTSVIGKLGTTPQERGLTTQQFKDKFDEGLKAFVEWFNLTHKTEFEAVQTDIATHKADNAAHGVNTKVSKSGDTMSGSLGVPFISFLNSTSSTVVLAEIQHASVRRWLFLIESNANLNLWDYDAEGGSPRAAIIINKENGQLYNLGNTVWHAGIAGPFYKGAGSPEGVVTAPVGAIYQRTDGGASTTLYVKESGSGNTGWRAV